MTFLANLKHKHTSSRCSKIDAVRGARHYMEVWNGEFWPFLAILQQVGEMTGGAGMGVGAVWLGSWGGVISQSSAKRG